MHGNKLSYINFDYIETRIQFSIKYKDTPKLEYEIPFVVNI